MSSLFRAGMRLRESSPPPLVVFHRPSIPLNIIQIVISVVDIAFDIRLEIAW